MRVIGAATLMAWIAGCTGEGDYEVGWIIGACQPDDPGPCDAYVACAPSGLDIVVLDWIRGESGQCAGEVAKSTEHACRDGLADGFVEAGTYNLCAEALSPDRARLTGVVVASDVPVGEGDLVIVTLAFPVVPQCGNGLDDDGDGRIDDRDRQCSDDLDAAE